MGKVEIKVEERPVVITVTIFPVKDGKRLVVMSGAPEGEMPELASGTFPAMHTMLDQMWMRLKTRKPVVVKKPEVEKVSAGGDEDEAEADDGDGDGGKKTVEEELMAAKAKFEKMTPDEVRAENEASVASASTVEPEELKIEEGEGSDE